MNSHDVILRNIVPMDLNFILYASSVYSNFYTENLSFPGHDSNNEGLLPYDEFLKVINDCWTSMLEKYKKPYSIMTNSGLILQNEYSLLFLDNNAGKEKLNKVWANFNLWWWPDFGIKSFLDRISDTRVVEIAEQLTALAKEASVSISDQELSLLVVFQQPPEYLKQQDSHLFVVHLSKLFENSVKSVSHSMFNNLKEDS